MYIYIYTWLHHKRDLNWLQLYMKPTEYKKLRIENTTKLESKKSIQTSNHRSSTVERVGL